MNISLAVHIIGIVLWLGGLIILPRLLKVAVQLPAEHASRGVAGIRRVFWGYAVSGLVLSMVSGIYQIAIGGVARYMAGGWFHGKLMFVIILIACSGLLAAQLSSTRAPSAINVKLLMMVHGLSALSLICIVFLTFLGR